MTLKFYHAKVCPSARAVNFTIKTLNIPYEHISIDLAKKEHKSAEYLKVNPQGTVPCIVDDNFTISDSHAINAYLVGKYAKDDKLYPKDLKARSVVDSRLHFDTGVLHATLKHIIGKILHAKCLTQVTPEVVEGFEGTYATLEKFLSKSKYVAGDDVTIADFSIISTLTLMTVLVPVKKEKFSNLAAYIERCKTNVPHGAELIEEGTSVLRGQLKSLNFQLSA